MNLKRLIFAVGMISVLYFSRETGAATIVSGDLNIRDGGDLVFSDGSVQTHAQLQGPVGPANNLSIGSVTPGVTAGANITGTAPNQVLNLTLPLGPQGPSGNSQITLTGICDAIRTGGASAPAFCLSPSVTSITSPSVMYSKQSSFTVNGTDLSGVLVTASGACNVLTESAGGTATTRTFTCTPTSVGPLNISAVAGTLVLKQITLGVPNPQATLITSMGTIVVELYPAKAPITVNNFLLYVNEGFYSNTIFHRVMSGFVVQGGGFGIDGAQKTPTHAAIDMEPPSSTGLINAQSTIAMARTNVLNSATSQFYFNTVNNNGTYSTVNPGLYSGNNLDVPVGQGYAVFGKVIQGFDVVKAIEAVPVTNSMPNTNVVVTSATQTK